MCVCVCACLCSGGVHIYICECVCESVSCFLVLTLHENFGQGLLSYKKCHPFLVLYEKISGDILPCLKTDKVWKQEEHLSIENLP